VEQVAERLQDDEFMGEVQSRAMLNLSLQKTTTLLDKLLGDEYDKGKYYANNMRFLFELIDVMGSKSMVSATVLRLNDAFKRSAVFSKKQHERNAATRRYSSIMEEVGDQEHEEACTLQLVMFLENACQSIAQSNHAHSADDSAKALTTPTTVALIVGAMARYASNGQVQNFGLTLLHRIHQLQIEVKLKNAARQAIKAKWTRGARKVSVAEADDAQSAALLATLGWSNAELAQFDAEEKFVESLHASNTIAVISNSLMLRPLLPAESIIFAVQLLQLMAKLLVKNRSTNQRYKTETNNEMHSVSAKLMVANMFSKHHVMDRIVPLIGYYSGGALQYKAAAASSTPTDEDCAMQTGEPSVSILLPCLRLSNLFLGYEQSATTTRRASGMFIEKMVHHAHVERDEPWHTGLLVQLHTVCRAFNEFGRDSSKIEYFDSDDEDEDEKVGYEKLEALGSQQMKLLRVRVAIIQAVGHFLPILKSNKVMLGTVPPGAPRRTRVRQVMAVTLLLFKHCQKQVRTINADAKQQQRDQGAMSMLLKTTGKIENVFIITMDVLLSMYPQLLPPRPLRKMFRGTPVGEEKEQEQREEEEQEEWEAQHELAFQIVTASTDYLCERCLCADTHRSQSADLDEEVSSDSFPLPVPMLFDHFRHSMSQACAVLTKAAHQKPGVEGGLLCGRSWRDAGTRIVGGRILRRESSPTDTLSDGNSRGDEINAPSETQARAKIHSAHGHPLAVRTVESLLLTLRVANGSLFHMHGGTEAIGIKAGASTLDGSAMGFMMPTVQMDHSKQTVDSHKLTRSVVLNALRALHELVLAVDVHLDPPGAGLASNTAASAPRSNAQDIARPPGVEADASVADADASVADLLDDVELEHMESTRRFASKHHHVREGMTGKQASKRRVVDAVKASLRNTRIHRNRCCATLQALGGVRVLTECMRVNFIDDEVLVEVYKPLRIALTSRQWVDQFYAHGGTLLTVGALHKHRSVGNHARHALEFVSRLIDVGYIELVVQVMCAFDLPLADVNKKGQAMPADPYSMVYWNDEMLGRSRSINDSSNPTWAGKNAFTVRMALCPSLGNSTLRIEVRDYDPEDSIGDLLGEVTIKGADMAQLIREHGLDQEGGSDGSSRIQSKGPSTDGAGVPEGSGRFFANLRLKKRENCTELQKVRGSLGVRWWPSADGNALYTTVVSAHALANLDLGADKSDPFCVIFFNGIKIGTTRHIADNLSPVWDETFRVPLKPDLPSSLRVEVRDFDGKGKTGAFLGQIHLNGAEMQRHASIPDWPRYYAMQKNWDSNEEQPLVKGSMGVAMTCITPTIIIAIMRHFPRDIPTQRACVWVMNQLGKKPRNLLDTVKAGGIFALMCSHRHFLPLAKPFGDEWVKVREVGGNYRKVQEDQGYSLQEEKASKKKKGLGGLFSLGEKLKETEHELEEKERSRVDACVLVNAIETTMCKMLHTSPRFFRMILQHQHLQKLRGAVSVSWAEPLMDRGIIPRGAPDSIALHAEGRRQVNEIATQAAAEGSSAGDDHSKTRGGAEHVSIGFEQCRKGSISTDKWRQITFPGMRTYKKDEVNNDTNTDARVLLRMGPLNDIAAHTATMPDGGRANAEGGSFLDSAEANSANGSANADAPVIPAKKSPSKFKAAAKVAAFTTGRGSMAMETDAPTGEGGVAAYTVVYVVHSILHSKKLWWQDGSEEQGGEEAAGLSSDNYDSHNNHHKHDDSFFTQFRVSLHMLLNAGAAAAIVNAISRFPQHQMMVNLGMECLRRLMATPEYTSSCMDFVIDPSSTSKALTCDPSVVSGLQVLEASILRASNLVLKPQKGLPQTSSGSNTGIKSQGICACRVGVNGLPVYTTSETTDVRNESKRIDPSRGSLMAPEDCVNPVWGVAPKPEPGVDRWSSNTVEGATPIAPKFEESVGESFQLSTLPVLSRCELRIEVRDFDDDDGDGNPDSVGDLMGEVRIEGSELQRFKYSAWFEQMMPLVKKKTYSESQPYVRGEIGLRLQMNSHLFQVCITRCTDLFANTDAADHADDDAELSYEQKRQKARRQKRRERGLGGDSDHQGLSDPYCLVFWNDALVGKTRAIENSLNPVFDEVFSIPLQSWEQTDITTDTDLALSEFDPVNGHTVSFELRRHHTRMKCPRAGDKLHEALGECRFSLRELAHLQTSCTHTFKLKPKPFSSESFAAVLKTKLVRKEMDRTHTPTRSLSKGKSALSRDHGIDLPNSTLAVRIAVLDPATQAATTYIQLARERAALSETIIAQKGVTEYTLARMCDLISMMGRSVDVLARAVSVDEAWTNVPIGGKGSETVPTVAPAVRKAMNSVMEVMMTTMTCERTARFFKEEQAHMQSAFDFLYNINHRARCCWCEVGIVRAADLVNADLEDRDIMGKMSFSDPFLEVYWNGCKVYETRHCANQQHPEWMEYTRIPLPMHTDPHKLSECELLLIIRDYDLHGGDACHAQHDFLGMVRLTGPELIELTTLAERGPAAAEATMRAEVKAKSLTSPGGHELPRSPSASQMMQPNGRSYELVGTHMHTPQVGPPLVAFECNLSRWKSTKLSSAHERMSVDGSLTFSLRRLTKSGDDELLRPRTMEAVLRATAALNVDQTLEAGLACDAKVIDEQIREGKEVIDPPIGQKRLEWRQAAHQASASALRMINSITHDLEATSNAPINGGDVDELNVSASKERTYIREVEVIVNELFRVMDRLQMEPEDLWRKMDADNNRRLDRHELLEGFRSLLATNESAADPECRMHLVSTSRRGSPLYTAPAGANTSNLLSTIAGVDELIKLFDYDGNGGIDVHEWKRGISQRFHERHHHKLQRLRLHMGAGGTEDAEMVATMQRWLNLPNVADTSLNVGLIADLLADFWLLLDQSDAKEWKNPSPNSVPSAGGTNIFMVDLLRASNALTTGVKRPPVVLTDTNGDKMALLLPEEGGKAGTEATVFMVSRIGQMLTRHMSYFTSFTHQFDSFAASAIGVGLVTFHHRLARHWKQHDEEQREQFMLPSSEFCVAPSLDSEFRMRTPSLPNAHEGLQRPDLLVNFFANSAEEASATNTHTKSEQEVRNSSLFERLLRGICEPELLEISRYCYVLSHFMENSKEAMAFFPTLPSVNVPSTQLDSGATPSKTMVPMMALVHLLQGTAKQLEYHIQGKAVKRGGAAHVTKQQELIEHQRLQQQQMIKSLIAGDDHDASANPGIGVAGEGSGGGQQVEEQEENRVDVLGAEEDVLRNAHLSATVGKLLVKMSSCGTRSGKGVGEVSAVGGPLGLQVLLAHADENAAELLLVFAHAVEVAAQLKLRRQQNPQRQQPKVAPTAQKSGGCNGCPPDIMDVDDAIDSLIKASCELVERLVHAVLHNQPADPKDDGAVERRERKRKRKQRASLRGSNTGYSSPTKLPTSPTKPTKVSMDGGLLPLLAQLQKTLNIPGVLANFNGQERQRVQKTWAACGRALDFARGRGDVIGSDEESEEGQEEEQPVPQPPGKELSISSSGNNLLDGAQKEEEQQRKAKEAEERGAAQPHTWAEGTEEVSNGGSKGSEKGDDDDDDDYGDDDYESDYDEEWEDE
jgi:hypothetical protein